ncbi:hypothetical protein GGR57DRAFT_460040 [Xylariaceae sp. FL1272]|nr:hypothetical protein GGR57DRAFT_460040 [Xylariaceae sp. FL1272]
MDRAAALRRQVYGFGSVDAFTKGPQKRVNSLPVYPAESWQPSDMPSRAKSLNSKIKPVSKVGCASRPSSPRPPSRASRYEEFIPEAIGLLRCSSVVPRVVDYTALDAVDDGASQTGYDSDEEDRRNGVPITYSQGPTRSYHPSMREEAEEEYMELKVERADIQELLEMKEQTYWIFRLLYFDYNGLDWTESRWLQYLELEDTVDLIRQRLEAVEVRMQNVFAQICSYMDHGPTMANSVAYQQDDKTIWDPQGRFEDRWNFNNDGDLELEWNGVNLNL